MTDLAMVSVYDARPMRWYVATGLEHAHRARAVMARLRSRGHRVTYDWTTHGSVQSEGPERLREVAEAELLGVIGAAVVVAILPGGRGTHTEIGAALAASWDRAVILLEEEGAYLHECAFYWAPGVIRRTWRAAGTGKDAQHKAIVEALGTVTIAEVHDAMRARAAAVRHG